MIYPDAKSSRRNSDRSIVAPIFFYIVFILAGISISIWGCSAKKQKQDPVPVIYSSDLFHPFGDMDDQIDIAALYGIPDIDIKAVILDHGRTQERRPGKIPIRQLKFITNRKVRSEIGLGFKLKSIDDKGLDQDEKYQQGVRFILDTLQKSNRNVVIISVGSLRDIAAAYNQSPELFSKKVDKLLIFAGEASKKGFVETNVRMDRHAFAAVMNSDLPVYWIPCFDGGLWKNNGRASYWQTSYGHLLKNVSNQLIKYFIYADKRDPSMDPIKFLSEPINEKDKASLFRKPRNLWSCSIFYIASGKTVIINDSGFEIVPLSRAKDDDLIFDFTPVWVRTLPSGEVYYCEKGSGHRVMQFRIRNKNQYQQIMTMVTADLLQKTCND